MDELDALRVRDEVLQAMYWMRGEELDAAPDAENLARFVGLPADLLETQLEALVADGKLERRAGGYRLSEEGSKLGARSFADEFSDLTKPGHGECDDDCWCHESTEHALDCIEHKRGVSKPAEPTPPQPGRS